MTCALPRFFLLWGFVTRPWGDEMTQGQRGERGTSRGQWGHGTWEGPVRLFSGGCCPERAGLGWSFAWCLQAVLRTGRKDAPERRREGILSALCGWQLIAWGRRWLGG